MKGFVKGYVVTLLFLLALGWFMRLDTLPGYAPGETVPTAIQMVAVPIYLMTSGMTAYLLFPVLGGLLGMWLGNSKTGRFSGRISRNHPPVEGRGCNIYPKVTIGDTYVGTVVVPDALDEAWRYPDNNTTAGGEAEILKIGRLMVAIRSKSRRNSDWGFFSIHKSYPFLAILLMLSVLVTWGLSLLVIYLPIYLWGQAKIKAMMGQAYVGKSAQA